MQNRLEFIHHKKVEKGEYFQIILPNHDSTGYDWYLESLPKGVLLKKTDVEKTGESLFGLSINKIFTLVICENSNGVTHDIFFRNCKSGQESTTHVKVVVHVEIFDPA